MPFLRYKEHTLRKKGESKAKAETMSLAAQLRQENAKATRTAQARQQVFFSTGAMHLNTTCGSRCWSRLIIEHRVFPHREIKALPEPRCAPQLCTAR